MKLNYKNINILFGGIAMQKTKKTVKEDTKYVITKDGIRMTYAEYIEMVQSERN